MSRGPKGQTTGTEPERFWPWSPQEKGMQEGVELSVQF